MAEVMAIFSRAGAAKVPIAARIEAAEALGEAGDPRLGHWSASGHWVEVPAGRFWMGAQKDDPNGRLYDPDAEDRESPAHEVALDAFRIARYPVTVAEFQPFVEEQGYHREVWWATGGFGTFDRPDDWDEQVHHPNRPVTGVCWWEAMAWCAWQDARLRRAVGGLQVGSGEQLRLPTEAEWERAARGDDGRRYAWGDQAPDAERSNYKMNVGDPSPVGVYPNGATPAGVQDLTGNVWEWCLDGFDDKWYQEWRQQGLVDIPVRSGAASSRVLRGGSFGDGAEDLRAAFRGGFQPEDRDQGGGFRCVLGPRRQP
jgi:formylglycine-generating enzyme required for sulfatase activity